MFLLIILCGLIMGKVAKHIGHRIRQIRQKKNISILALSYLSNIEYSHLSKIEFGKLNTSLIHLIKIANALDVCLLCFFSNSSVDTEQLIQSKTVDTALFSEIQDMDEGKGLK
jgi:transcriptional regulator with XRE-family HTH domain